MNPARHRLDVTTVTGREEVALAFGPIAAWQAAITRIMHKEAKATDTVTKRYLRLQLLNAQTQLALLTDPT